MKRFRCGDVIPGCLETFTAPDEDQVLALGAAHAAAAHGVTHPGPELIAAVRSHVHDV